MDIAIQEEDSSEVATDLQERQKIHPHSRLLAHLTTLILCPCPTVSRGKLWQTNEHPQTRELASSNVKISRQPPNHQAVEKNKIIKRHETLQTNEIAAKEQLTEQMVKRLINILRKVCKFIILLKNELVEILEI